jgi:pimeloyl-ACP methyl ester carboxylesterase
MGQLISFPGAATTRVYNGKALFISGGLSNYVRPENHELIYRMFPKAEFAVITGAGHWVHADQPERLVSCVKEFLRRAEPAS